MCTDDKDKIDEAGDFSPTADAPAKVEQFLCFALYSASLAMTKLYKSRLTPLGLTYPQYVVLLALWEKDNVTVSEIGARVCLDSGTLSQLLKRLEVSGFITRQRDLGGDERRVLILLTEQGQRLREKAAGVPADMISAMDTPYEELSELASMVTVLRQKLIDASH